MLRPSIRSSAPESAWSDCIVRLEPVELDMEVRGMRTRVRWPVLVALVAMLALAACGNDSEPTPSASQGPAATTSCASSGELTMWERSGGNKDMVDMLVAAWNMLTNGDLYRDPGADYFANRTPAKTKDRAIRQLQALGYHVTIA